jgi:hypothetical protein
MSGVFTRETLMKLMRHGERGRERLGIPDALRAYVEDELH